MKKDEFWNQMSNFAFDTYLKRKVGLTYSLQFNENFSKILDKNYRMKQYEENGKLFMTSNERLFHLIGFVDALSWLTNQGLIDTKTIQEVAGGKINQGDAGQSYDGLTRPQKYIEGANCVNTLYWYELIGSDAWDY
jgi:hypothetical protein